MKEVNAKIQKPMPRLTYSEIFRLINENTLEVLRKIKVGAVELDKGTTITRGTLLGGLDFFKYLDFNAELEGDDENGVWVLKKVIYRES
jgi:hypothetical protein